MTDEEREALRDDGWELECESPLEIRHVESGSFATGYAAEIVIEYLLIPCGEE